MPKKIFSLMLIFTIVFSLCPHSVYAVGGKEATASLFLPTTGQAMNGELGKTKTKIMGGVEVASIATIAILGITTGGAAVLIGLGPLAANHLWSSMDAYKGAKNKQNFQAQDQLSDAQRSLELSREGRFEREQGRRLTIRERLERAREGSEG
ncbi:MAG TPA: hypothetical protein VJC08_02700 [bacterium]|nr:hypothetical protein [bacterium]